MLMCYLRQKLFRLQSVASGLGPLLLFHSGQQSVNSILGILLKQARKLQDAQAEKLTSLQANKLTS